MVRIAYAVLAVLALVGTQAALVWHIVDGRGVTAFVTDAAATPAGVFALVDLCVVAVVAVVFMLAEGRRLGMQHLWLYVVLTFTVAISVAFPVFLLVRARHLRWPDGRPA